MTDPREALVAHLERTGMGYGLHDGLRREVLASWADSILTEFDVIPRGEGVTTQIGGRRAGRTQALAERVADEVMKRGGAATVISLPPVEDVARALAELNEDTDWEGGVESYLPDARVALSLLPGRTETEVKAEALREAAEAVPGSTSDDPIDPYDHVAEWLIDRANRIEKEDRPAPVVPDSAHGMWCPPGCGHDRSEAATPASADVRERVRRALAGVVVDDAYDSRPLTYGESVTERLLDGLTDAVLAVVGQGVTADCNCGFGGQHDPANPRCRVNRAAVRPSGQEADRG